MSARDNEFIFFPIFILWYGYKTASYRDQAREHLATHSAQELFKYGLHPDLLLEDMKVASGVDDFKQCHELEHVISVKADRIASDSLIFAE